MVYVDKGVVRLCGARSSSHGSTTLVPEVFLSFFFFVKERASREAGTMKRIFLSYGKLKPELVRKDFSKELKERRR